MFGREECSLELLRSDCHEQTVPLSPFVQRQPRELAVPGIEFSAGCTDLRTCVEAQGQGFRI